MTAVPESDRLLQKVDAVAAPHGLMAMGGTHTDAGKTIVLVGTSETFWDHFTEAPEYSDGGADPVDRWSQRIIPQLMLETAAQGVVYPFGGPPYAPFLAWAKQTGEAFDSPVGMLVHQRAGLMISYRGALVFDACWPLPVMRPRNPCKSCTERPCLTACPVDALSGQHVYDVPACKSYLDTAEGNACVALGCAVRRACPISASFDRPAAQSAHHMRAFKGELA